MSEILVLSGSNRKGSYNTCLAKNLVRIMNEMDIKAKYLDLADYPMPMLNEDLFANKPETVKALKAVFASNKKFVICTPEHNYSITAYLKNTIDWISRADPEDKGPMIAFKGKIIGILSASPSGFGGLRSQLHLQQILATMGSIVYPSSVNVSKAYETLASEMITDADLIVKLQGFAEGFAKFDTLG